MNWNNFIQPLGWTLLHFIWQGVAIAAVFAIAQFALRKRSANARYLTGCCALGLLMILPVITFHLQRGETFVPAVETTEGMPIAGIAQPISSPGLPEDQGVVMESGSGVIAAVESDSVKFGEHLERAFPWLIGFWLCGVSFLSLRLLVGWVRLRKLKLQGVESVELELLKNFANLKARLGISRPVKLLKSALVQVPTVIGWLKPVVLLPASSLSGLTPSQLEAILVHELAHIRRHDFLVNLLQSFLETVLFYHPAVWWISKQVREEREHCCDDLVVQISGDRINYVRALATLEELRSAPTELALAADGGSLLARIRRLLQRPSEDTNRSAAWLSGVAVIGCIVLIALGNLVSAQSPAAANALEALPRTNGVSLLQFRLVTNENIPGETEEFIHTNRNESRTYHVYKEVLMNEEHILRAEAMASQFDPKRQEILVQLTLPGVERFSAITKENVGKQVAIIYQGKLLSAPNIAMPITSKSLQIAGDFTREEAEAMAAKLNSAPGVNPASITAPFTFVSLKTNKNVLQFTWKLPPTEPVLRQHHMFHQEGGKPAGYSGMQETVSSEDSSKPFQLILEVEPLETQVVYRVSQVTATGTNATTSTNPVPESASLLILYETEPGLVSNQGYQVLWNGVWLKSRENVGNDILTCAVFTDAKPGVVKGEPQQVFIDHSSKRPKDLIIEFGAAKKKLSEER